MRVARLLSGFLFVPLAVLVGKRATKFVEFFFVVDHFLTTVARE